MNTERFLIIDILDKIYGHVHESKYGISFPSQLYNFNKSKLTVSKLTKFSNGRWQFVFSVVHKNILPNIFPNTAEVTDITSYIITHTHQSLESDASFSLNFVNSK